MKTSNKSDINLTEFTDRMKDTDLRYSKMLKTMRAVYYVLVPLYFIFAIDSFWGYSSLYKVASIWCMFISLVIFLFLLLYSYKEYKYIDYSLPTLHLLKKAAKRYKFFQGKSWWAIFALSIMEVGMILDNLEFNTLTLIVAFTLVMIGSLSAGAIWWYIRYKPMRDGALRLIHEIEKCEEE